MTDKIDAQNEQKIVNEMKRITCRKAISFKINRSKKPSLTDSKFGGIPYWDLKKEYPKSSNDELLMMLAQINLDELNREGKNVENKLPKGGMLQFFINGYDDTMGMDFDFKFEDGRLKQDGFRVVYHETIDYNVSPDEIMKIDMPISTDSCDLITPVFKEVKVDSEVRETYIGGENFQFQQILQQAAKAFGFEINENDSPFELFEDHGDIIYEQLNTSGHWMLGYPAFTQEDPRGFNKDLVAYNVQLFQMDSDGEEVLWGDCGVANFFIKDEDLAKKDFSNILYSWDCC